MCEEKQLPGSRLKAKKMNIPARNSDAEEAKGARWSESQQRDRQPSRPTRVLECLQDESNGSKCIRSLRLRE